MDIKSIIPRKNGGDDGTFTISQVNIKKVAEIMVKGDGYIYGVVANDSDNGSPLFLNLITYSFEDIKKMSEEKKIQFVHIKKNQSEKSTSLS